MGQIDGTPIGTRVGRLDVQDDDLGSVVIKVGIQHNPAYFGAVCRHEDIIVSTGIPTQILPIGCVDLARGPVIPERPAREFPHFAFGQSDFVGDFFSTGLSLVK